MRAKLIHENNESEIYSKHRLIELIVSDYDPETQDVARKYLYDMTQEEFEDFAKCAGFNQLGKYWTTEDVY